MSCEEIICIENIVDIQATYYIMNLSLSDLIEDIITEIQKGFLPILEIRVFFHSLNSIPFTDEAKGQQILDTLSACMENQLYLTQSDWNAEKIMENIIKLQMLILWDYVIDGSLVVFEDNEI